MLTSRLPVAMTSSVTVGGVERGHASTTAGARATLRGENYLKQLSMFPGLFPPFSSLSFLFLAKIKGP